MCSITSVARSTLLIFSASTGVINKFGTTACVLSVQVPSIFGDLAVKDGDMDDGKSIVLKRKRED